MFNKLKAEEERILLSIPILFILGTLFHFLYDLTGQIPFIALISAVNESIWEHGKMVVLPPILFWVLFYLSEGEKYAIEKNKWFTAALGSVITMIITIPMLYYFYTQAFGVELLWVDISILLLANIFGQLIGLHLYRYAKGIKWYVSVMLLCLIILVFAIFTYNPPHLPIFMDSETGLFGIK